MECVHEVQKENLIQNVVTETLDELEASILSLISEHELDHSLADSNKQKLPSDKDCTSSTEDSVEVCDKIPPYIEIIDRFLCDLLPGQKGVANREMECVTINCKQAYTTKGHTQTISHNTDKEQTLSDRHGTVQFASLKEKTNTYPSQNNIRAHNFLVCPPRNGLAYMSSTPKKSCTSLCIDGTFNVSAISPQVKKGQLSFIADEKENDTHLVMPYFSSQIIEKPLVIEKQYVQTSVIGMGQVQLGEDNKENETSDAAQSNFFELEEGHSDIRNQNIPEKGLVVQGGHNNNLSQNIQCLLSEGPVAHITDGSANGKTNFIPADPGDISKNAVLGGLLSIPLAVNVGHLDGKSRDTEILPVCSSPGHKIKSLESHRACHLLPIKHNSTHATDSDEKSSTIHVPPVNGDDAECYSDIDTLPKNLPLAITVPDISDHGLAATSGCANADISEPCIVYSLNYRFETLSSPISSFRLNQSSDVHGTEVVNEFKNYSNVSKLAAGHDGVTRNVKSDILKVEPHDQAMYQHENNSADDSESYLVLSCSDFDDILSPPSQTVNTFSDVPNIDNLISIPLMSKPTTECVGRHDIQTKGVRSSLEDEENMIGTSDCTDNNNDVFNDICSPRKPNVGGPITVLQNKIPASEMFQQDECKPSKKVKLSSDIEVAYSHSETKVLPVSTDVEDKIAETAKSAALVPVISYNLVSSSTSQESHKSVHSELHSDQNKVIQLPDENSEVEVLHIKHATNNEPGSSKEAKVPQPFISNDPLENLDNSHPDWEIMKHLENDDERYQKVKEFWKSKKVPNPKRNLTYHSYRKRFLRSDKSAQASGSNTNRGTKRSAQDSVDDQQRSMKRRRTVGNTTHCTYIIQSKIDNFNNHHAQEVEVAHNQYKMQHRNLTEEQAQEVDSFNRAYSMYSQYNLYGRSYMHLQIKHQREIDCTYDQYCQRLAELKQLYNSKILVLKDALKEIERFSNFYQGLNGEDEDPTVLTEAEMQDLYAIDNVYDKFNLFYKSSN